MNLTEALAVSNNPYFRQPRVKLAFERVNYTPRLFGLGERAGLNIEGRATRRASRDVPPANGGVGMMTSFGKGS